MQWYLDLWRLHDKADGFCFTLAEVARYEEPDIGEMGVALRRRLDTIRSTKPR